MLSPAKLRVPWHLVRIALPALALVVLSGCSEREWKGFWEGMILLLVVFLVAMAVFHLVLLGVLIMGITKLVQKTPNAAVGVTAIVLGAFVELPSLLAWGHGAHIAGPGSLLGVALIWVGVLNVRRVREALAQPPPDPAPPPAPPAPPPPPTPPPERTLAPPWP
jgi:hypothetical protein